MRVALAALFVTIAASAAQAACPGMMVNQPQPQTTAEAPIIPLPGQAGS